MPNGYVKVERVSGTAPFYADGVINDQPNSDGPLWDPDIVRVTAILQKQSLNVAVNLLRIEAAYFTDGLDPQGYVRQQLNSEAERALLLADFMLDVGEGSAMTESY